MEATKPWIVRVDFENGFFDALYVNIFLILRLVAGLLLHVGEKHDLRVLSQ